MKLLFTIIILAVSCVAYAVQPDSLMRTFNEKSSLERQYDIVNNINPSGNKSFYSNQFLSSKAGAQSEELNHLAPIEYGTNLNTYGLNFEGYQKINSSIVWGQATYSNEFRSNVQFNNVADYRFLYPYIVADSLGGDRRMETYILKGGFQHQTTKLTYGIEAEYRAALSNGYTDPRPLNTVSDFTLKAGISKSVLNHQLGIFAMYGNYNQELRVNTYINNTNEYIYVLRGFGLVNTNISGPTSAYNNNYFANSFGGGITLNPESSGFTGLLVYQTDRIILKESNTNNAIVPFNLSNNQLNIELGYRYLTDDYIIQTKAGIERYSKIGTERTYSTDNRDLLSISKPFNHTETNYKANILLVTKKDNLARFESFGQISYSVTDAFHLGDGTESYFTNISSLNPYIHYKWHHYWKSSALTIGQDLRGRFVMNSNASLRNDGTMLSAGVAENFNRSTQNLIQSKMSVNYTVFTPKNNAWSIEPSMIVTTNGDIVNMGGNISLIHNF